MAEYTWTPSTRIETWNHNLYNGKPYFEAGETVRGMPYTLFTWEMGVDSLLSLAQYKAVSAENYSTTQYCNALGEERTGPIYGNCCATFVSEVFGGYFMNGENPRCDGVSRIKSSPYATTYTRVRADRLQPGDAVSNTKGNHVVWISDVQPDCVTLYESTPPVCRSVTLQWSDCVDENGYLVYGGSVYHTVSRSNAMVRDDLQSAGALNTEIPAPLCVYTRASGKTIVYDAIGGEAKANKIYDTDLCVVDAVFTNGWCHVNFPLDAGGMEHGYVPLSVFLENSTAAAAVADARLVVYAEANTSAVLERLPAGTTYYKLQETSEGCQILYPLSSGGYGLGWMKPGDAQEPEDVFLQTLCPIRSYPCVSETFEVKKSDYTTRGGEIYPTDLCTIEEVYSDGWCCVTFPLDSGGELTAYTPLQNFVLSPSYPITTCTTTRQIDVYPKQDLSLYQNWWTGVGDVVYVLGETETALQICYPIDAAYGGGYKLGWIARTDIPGLEPAPEEPATVASVTVSAMPNKTEYIEGEAFESAGLTLTAHMSDGTEQTVTSGFTVSGYDPGRTGQQTLTVTYGGKSATFTVTVRAAQVQPEPTGAKITVSQTSGIVGGQARVTLRLDENPGITSMLLSVSYDMNALRLVKVEDKGILGSAYHSDNLKSPYTLSWANDTSTSNFTADGEIVTLVFDVLDTAPLGESAVTVRYDYDNYDIIDKDMNPIRFAVTDGSVRITDVLVGDVNGDGAVNTLDRVVLTRYLADWAEYPEGSINLQAADVNGDGAVNTLDRVILTRYLANWNGYEALPYKPA